jgi:hypothetical protein
LGVLQRLTFCPDAIRVIVDQRLRVKFPAQVRHCALLPEPLGRTALKGLLV